MKQARNSRVTLKKYTDEVIEMLSFLGASIVLGWAYVLVKTSDQQVEKKEDIEAINDIFKEKKLKNFKDEYAYVSSKRKYPHYNEYGIQLPLGKTTDELEKCIPAIETYFKNNANVEYRNKCIFIKLYTTDLSKKYTFKAVKVDKTKGLSVFLGNSREGAVIEDLSVNPHLSVVGATGSGKSVFVNCILCNLIENYTEDELELVLFDLKGNELNEYASLKHTVYHTRRVEEAIEYFDVLADELEARYELLGNYRDIKAYNKANPNNRMKYQFIVIEECFSLLQYKKHYDKLGEVMSKARACGMHFMLTTQRPNGDIIPKVAYTHVGIKVGLRTSSAQESINAIEVPGLEKINDLGAGIINLNGHYVFFKGSYISDEQIIAITKKHASKGAERHAVEKKLPLDNKDAVKSINNKMFKFEGE